MKRVLGVVAAVVLLVTGLAFVATPAGAAVDTVTVVPSPNNGVGVRNRLNDTACTSPTNCVAVGYWQNGASYETLIEVWNGSTWSIVSSPNATSSQNNILHSVSCVSSNFCVAVGEFNNGSAFQTLVLQWNGSAWSVVSSPNTSAVLDNTLSAVSCVSSSFCSAVGYYDNGADIQPLSLTWNGSSWASTPIPVPGSVYPSRFFDVSCASQSMCFAVGSYTVGPDDFTLTEMWNGSSWAIVSSPNIPYGSNNSNYLLGVACTSATFCQAVGSYYDGNFGLPLGLSWNGSAWTTVSLPSMGATFEHWMMAISCLSETFCVSAGFYDSTGIYQPFISTWNGTSWSILNSDAVNPVNETQLRGVSCASPYLCMAVGTYDAGNYFQTQAATITGVEPPAPNVDPIAPVAPTFTG